MKKILILGSSGMAGHVVYSYLNSLSKFQIFDTSQALKINENTISLDICDKKALEQVIFEIKPDYIINCIGLLIKGANSNIGKAIYVNSYFPHQLAQLAKEISGRLIHISTDCVFSGSKGEYVEDDYKDGKDTYAHSKALGEVVNDRDLTIRTSIIGPELKNNGEGLLHWFLTNKISLINGYTEAFWSGVTTLELAKAIEQFIEQEITGLYHLTAPKKINKFDLLNLFKNTWNKNKIEVQAFKNSRVDKSLVDTRKTLKFEVKPYDLMLFEMAEFMDKHKGIYEQYQ